MSKDKHEDERPRAVAFQNAQSTHAPRQRADKELREAKEALERRTVELHRQREWFRVTLSSIGDGVITTDVHGRINFMNPVAEKLTGWPAADAIGEDLTVVFKIIDERTGEAALNPLEQILAGQTLKLDPYTALIARTGASISIEDSVAPIKDEAGQITGIILVFHDVSARRRAEAALRESEERFRSLFQQAAVGIAIARVDGRFEQANDRFCELFGYSREEVLQRGFRDVTHPEDLARTDENMRLLLSGELPEFTYEKRYIRKDGTTIWAAVAVAPLRDETGKPRRLIGVVEDITERRRVEEIRSRLAAVVESSDDAIVSKTLEGIVTTWNRGAEQIFGYTAEEMIGKPINILIPSARENEEPRILERLKRGEKIDHYETVRRRKDGSLLDISLTISPVRDADGKIIGASKIARDITARKRAESALREETRNLELLNESGMAIASKLDLQSIVQTVTDAATQLSGAKFGAFFYNVLNEQGESFMLYALSGARRADFEKFGLPRNTPVFDPTFRGQGVVRSGDITKDPRYGHMAPHHGMPAGHLPVRSYLAVPVISRSGEVIGGLFFGHPEPNVFSERSERLVTGVAAQAAVAIDNARLYEKVARQAEELERQVNDRTAALQRTVGELESFSYSISHDLRAPLRAMQSFALILAEECGPQIGEQGRDYIRRITTAAQRMDQLIQDVLNYSRVARSDLLLTRVDSEKLLRNILESYPAFQPPRAQVELRGPFPVVVANEAVLTQCLSNLLGNAVKFVQRGTVPRVEVTSQQVGNGRVRLLIKDNGIGIDPGSHDKIFGIFERLSNTYEGTGIGLAIVKKGIERMGGSVGLNSTPGQGSAFWLELQSAENENPQQR